MAMNMETSVAESTQIGEAENTESKVDVKLEIKGDLTLSRFRRRSERSQEEDDHLKGVPENGWFFGAFFLHHPPLFHLTDEDCGAEVHKGHVSKWTTFLLVETLLAALAIQPLVTNVGQIKGWKREVYGSLWMLTLLGSFLGLVVNAALLGHLIHCPRHLAWFWLCRLGMISDLPRLFLWLTSILMFLSIGFTTWSLYGFPVGILCVVVESAAVCFSKLFLLRLKNSLIAIYGMQ